MKVRVFTVRLDPATGAFDDAELVAFLADKEALAVHEHLLVHDGVPTWGVLVSYRQTTQGSATGERGTRHRRDWRADLDEADQPVFDALRRWRNERAVREGRPAYVLLTNRQLFEITRRRPADLAQLGEVHGVGAARVQAFGAELLEVLRAIDAT